MNPIRVLIVDDHPVVREGLRQILGLDPKIQVVSVVATGKQAVIQAKRLCPDIILMDIGLQGMSGIETTGELRQKQPASKVIMLTVHEDQRYLAEAVQAGAIGYLLKDMAPKALCQAVRKAYNEQSPIASSMTRPLLKQLATATTQETTSKSRLSERQLEILRLIATGATNKQIADQLFFSPATIKMEVNRIFAQLNASNRAEVIAEAYKSRLL